MTTIRIDQAGTRDAETVGLFVSELMKEIVPHHAASFDPNQFTTQARKLLENGTVWAFIARTKDETSVGILTLYECATIYARGEFGVISELYVIAQNRSEGVGAKLLDAATQFAPTRGWSGLEVTTPSQPTWQRTVDFYTRYGFGPIGPRLSLAIS